MDERFGVKRECWVADRGMISKGTIHRRRLDEAQRERRISGRAEAEIQDRDEIRVDEEMAWFWEKSLSGFG